ncbi:hypothetical protein F5888DRAFT_1808326 [Russula emetica]|nr:hypothetical protein F5888DRAFT_1808326 [Russula emetica]
MSPFFVGPISARSLLNCFLPPPSDPSSVPQFPTGLFDDFIKSLSQTESASYDKFIEAISPHVPSLIIVNTSRSSDKAPRGKFHLKLKPNCSMKSEADPFVLKVPSNPRDHTSNSGDDLNSFLYLTSGSQSNLGQITAYATAIMSAQYRTHTFSWCSRHRTDILQFATTPFRLLIRYGIADSEVRGHDSTVHSSSTPEEIALARAIVPELKDVESFLVLTIPDDSDRPSERRYINLQPRTSTGYPRRSVDSVVIRLGCQRKASCPRQDSWRVLLKDIKPEGELYDLLHQGKVDNIPSCLSLVMLAPTSITKLKLTSTIGRKLEEFKCTREFVNAMYAALKAHKAAHDIGILHRDISPGNILIACDDELTIMTRMNRRFRADYSSIGISPR